MTHQPTRITHTLLALSMATALAFGLSACGKKDDTKAATQVAAKVGSEEISVHQINQVLSRTNTAGAPPEAVKAMSRTVLEKLIDQQIAVTQATEKNLHRTPDVVAQIEAAKRDILARAYMLQVAGALPKPTPEETKKYFTDNPALFAQRRIFNVQEIMLPTQPGAAEQLRAAATPGRSMDDIATDLKARGLKFNSGSATRAAEQIPLDLLTKIHPLQDGQSTVIESAQGITYMRLVSSQTAPVDEATALPRIEQFLANQRATEAVAANIKQLRTDATVTYLGEFANPAPTAAAEAAAPAPAPAAAPAAANAAQTAIEKGVAGLK